MFTIKGRIFVVAAACIGLLLVNAVAASALDTVAGDFYLKANPDPRNKIRIEMASDRDFLRPGDQLTIKVRVDRRCYLNVFYIGHDGNVTLLWPNAGTGWDNLAQAGETIEIPGPRSQFSLTADGRHPTETIVACAEGSKDSIFRPQDFTSPPGRPVKRFAGSADELRRIFQARVDDLRLGSEWGTATLAVRVATADRGTESDGFATDLQMVSYDLSTGSQYNAFADRGATDVPDQGSTVTEGQDITGYDPGSVSNPNGDEEPPYVSTAGEDQRFKEYEPPPENEPRYYEKAICGVDGRKRINPTKTPPFKKIVKLQVRYPNSPKDSFICTGALVGPRMVLTCGHCVYNSSRGGWAKFVEVIPGLNLAEKPYGSQYASRLHSNTAWTGKRDFNHDWAIVELPDTTLTKRVGYMGYGYWPDSQILGRNVNTAGYPGDKCPDGSTPGQGRKCPDGSWNKGTTMWKDYGKIDSVKTNTFHYQLDSFGGQSGSPVWWYKKQNDWRRVVGIHSGSIKRGGVAQCPNRATRITPYLFNRLKTLRQTLKSTGLSERHQ